MGKYVNYFRWMHSGLPIHSMIVAVVPWRQKQERLVRMNGDDIFTSPCQLYDTPFPMKQICIDMNSTHIFGIY